VLVAESMSRCCAEHGGEGLSTLVLIAAIAMQWSAVGLMAATAHQLVLLGRAGRLRLPQEPLPLA
jgi:hypothetical protein